MRRKLVGLAIILSLLSIPSSLLPFYDLAVTYLTTADVTRSVIRGIPGFFTSLFASGQSPEQQELLADRIASVSLITITPRKFVAYVGDKTSFSALPTDYAGHTIQGAKFSWLSSDTDKIEIDDSGRARFIQPGLARVICRAGSVEASVSVLIRPGHRPLQSDAEWAADSDSTGAASRPYSLLDKLLPTAHAQSGGAYIGNDFLYQELYTEPRNMVGSPRNRAAEATRLGAVMPEGSNFEMGIPVVGLSGRGLGVSLSLFYNSRVWARHGNAVTFDPVAGFPGPGFSLGYGRIVTFASGGYTKFVLIEADGTRRYLGQVATPKSGPASGTFETSDGSHITFVGNAASGGCAYYPNGTKVCYASLNNKLLANWVEESNGNYITIAYKTTNPPVTSPQAIDYITDTQGRVIQFNYDSNGKLTSITAPGFGGTSQNPVTDTLARFEYQTVSVSNSFSGLTVENLPSGSVEGLRKVYFPGTGNGYIFSYSAYGMIHNYSVRKDMVVQVGGSISDGTEKAAVSFNYPTTASSLTDAPSFSQRTETALDSPSSTFSYSTSDDAVAQTRTFTVTLPDSSQMLMTRSTNTGSAANGLLVQSEVKRFGVSFAKSVFAFANDGGGSPQVQSVTSYDDAGTPTKVDFTYDSYGNVTNKREYGYQISGNWQVRRRTRTTYKTDTAYINAYLRGLVILEEILDAKENTNDNDDEVMAKKAYTYDDYQAMGGMEAYSGQPAPPNHASTHDTTYTVRGNVTGTTQWSDIAGNVSTTRLKKYDKYGNVVKEQLSCCNEQSYTFDQAHYWSKPVTVIKGTAVQLTSTATYDFNTSTAKSHTGPTDQTITSSTTNYSYDAAMRPSTTTYATGATYEPSYDDGLMMVTGTKSYSDGGGTIEVSATTVHDGWGRVIKEKNIHGGQVNITYDAMGRVESRTNPFTQGGQPGPQTSYTYDALGRTTDVSFPDGDKVETTYSGSSVTIVDQVNRKIKRESDGLGRLVKVTEQDSTGALAQETTYTYNLLDKLVQVNQGGQYRAYKYDALGRLLYERIPEHQATINDGTGTYWTTKYVYNDFNAVTIRTNARGVETHYGYDTLHRLTSVWYTGVGGNVQGTVRPALPSGVAATPDVSYSYSAAAALSQVTVGGGVSLGGSEEVYGYDSYGRASSVTRKIGTGGGQYRTYATSYQYNGAGQRAQITYPSSRVVSTSYDIKGRPSSVGDLHSVTYNIAGQVTGSMIGTIGGTRIEESYGYDSQRMQMISQTATKTVRMFVIPQGWTDVTTTLMSLNYSYQASAGQNGANTTAGNSGQLMAVNNNSTINGTAESASYTYDLQGRVVTSSQTTNSASAQRRFAYDRWGNRTGVWDATSGGNQIQSVSLEQSGGAPTNRLSSVTTSGATKNYTYDAAGNITDDGTHTYVYDGENRLASVDSGAASYGYDHQNRRIKKTVSGATTHYVWEGSQVIAEYNASTGGLIIEYTYAGSRMLTAGPRYVLKDRLSARLILDSSYNVVGRQGHLPFGEELGASGTTDKHKLTSYERDTETNTDYAVNRQHSPSIGRFIQVDRKAGQLASPQTLNLYTYAANDPVNLIDPLGLDPLNPSIIGPYHCPAWIGGSADCADYMNFFMDNFIGVDLDGGGGGGGGSGDHLPTFPTPQPRPSRPRLRYVSFHGYVRQFFMDKPNCVTDFRRLGIYDAFLRTSENARGVDFTDPQNMQYITLRFRDVGINSRNGPRNSQIGFVLWERAYGVSWWDEQVITIGGAFYTQDFADRLVTMVHENLHLHFRQGHLDIAERLGLGSFATEPGASGAINDWLEDSCMRTN